MVEVSYGWPIPAITKDTFHIDQHVYKQAFGVPLTYRDAISTPDRQVLATDREEWSKNLALSAFPNTASILVILYMVGRTSEWLIRRREARKT